MYKRQGWDGLLQSFGLNGFSDIGKNLGYVLAMLPDVLAVSYTHLLIPIVIQERHTFLMLPHALTPCLRFGELRKQIALCLLYTSYD